MPLGITQSSLAPDDLERSFQMAAQAGADGIELTCATAEHVGTLLDEKAADKISGLAKQHKLNVPSLGLAILTQGESLFGDARTVKTAVKLIRKAMDAAKGTGAGVVLLPFQGKATIDTENELQRVLESLTELAEEAEGTGLILGVESNLTVNQQIQLADELAPYGSVKLYFDTANMLARKLDPAICLRDLGAERICQVHLHDVRPGDEGTPPQWQLAPGEGRVDFGAVGQAMEAIGFEGWSILETAPGDADTAKANVEFMRGLLAGE